MIFDISLLCPITTNTIFLFFILQLKSVNFVACSVFRRERTLKRSTRSGQYEKLGQPQCNGGRPVKMERSLEEGGKEGGKENREERKKGRKGKERGKEKREESKRKEQRAACR